MDNKELIKKGLSVREDTAKMGKLERVYYCHDLYEQINALPFDPKEERREEAQQLVNSIWKLSIALLKEEMHAELVRRASARPYCSIGETYEEGEPQIVDVEISEDFSAEISYRWDDVIRIAFSRKVRDSYGTAISMDVVLKWKAIPEWMNGEFKFVRGYFEKEVTLENWLDVFFHTADALREHKKDFSALCNASSNVDKEVNVKKVYTTWKTKGRILSLTKEMPIAHIYHAKQDEQDSWDHSPYVHGSNGTSVENVQAFWSLNIKIKRPSYEVPNPMRTNLDIHEYITQSLMPKLGWGRITQQRLDRLNEILKGTDMDLVTTDTTEAALYRNFLPVGFKTWDEYLDSIILPKIKG